MKRSRRWTIDQLREAVRSSKSYAQTLRNLGLTGYGGSYRAIKARIAEEQISTAHFAGSDWDRTASKRAWSRRFSPAQLRDAVVSSTSVRQAIAALGLRGYGGNYRTFWKYVKEQQLSTAHFKGRGWKRGTRGPSRYARPLEEVLQKGSVVQSHSLKLRLMAAGLVPRHCEECGWATRSPDGRLPLELDHKNGDHSDNRLENLRVLCPNCHSLQSTHRGRNIARGTREE